MRDRPCEGESIAGRRARSECGAILRRLCEDRVDVRDRRVVCEERGTVVGWCPVRAQEARGRGDRVGRVPDVRESVAVSVRRVAIRRRRNRRPDCGDPALQVEPMNCMGPVAPLAFIVPGGLQPADWLRP
jgi:hypothetical protein